MLKIGEFSKLCQISIRSLRHYDKIGLFKPRTIHPENGYRYYSLDQLPRINQITAYKRMGFSLEQIRDLLHEGAPIQDVWTQLCQKRAEQQHLLSEHYRRLNAITLQIQAIEAQHTTQQHQPIVIKSVPTQSGVSRRQNIPDGTHIGHIFRRFASDVRQQGASIRYFIGVFHRQTQKDHHNLIFNYETINGRRVYAHERPGGINNDFEAVLLLDDTHKAMNKAVLPSVNPVASIIYQGVLNHRGMYYRVLDNWMDTQGYALNGAIREIYYRVADDMSSPDNLIEIQFPIASRVG